MIFESSAYFYWRVTRLGCKRPTRERTIPLSVRSVMNKASRAVIAMGSERLLGFDERVISEVLTGTNPGWEMRFRGSESIRG
jgi:hypothetical protein